MGDEKLLVYIINSLNVKDVSRLFTKSNMAREYSHTPSIQLE